MNYRKLAPSVLVKLKDERLVARYVQAFMEILAIGTDGKVSTTQGFKLDIYLKILIHNIDLYEVSAADLKWGFLYKTLFRLKRCQRHDVEMFRLVLAAVARRYLRRPIRKYQILFLLHVAEGQFSGFRSFNVLGTRLLSKNWKYIRKHLGFQKFSSRFAQNESGF